MKYLVTNPAAQRNLAAIRQNSDQRGRRNLARFQSQRTQQFLKAKHGRKK
jgi:hypothetical protein